jgi:hypothetical protein
MGIHSSASGIQCFLLLAFLWWPSGKTGIELGKIERKESLRAACGGEGAPIEKSAIMTFGYNMYEKFRRSQYEKKAFGCHCRSE